MTTRKLLVSALALSLWGACMTDDSSTSNPDEETGSTSSAVTSRADGIVSLALARAVAESFDRVEGRTPRHVRDHSVLLDANQRPALFAFNFVEGGYVVVSAELQFAPILAFNDTGELDLARLPDGPNLWAADMRGAIETVRSRGPADDAARTTRIAADREERVQWQPFLDALGAGTVDAVELTAARGAVEADICFDCPPPPTEACTSYSTTTTGPSVPVAWAQGCGYNSAVPASNSAALCYHMPTGCTATAIGQLMFRWKHAPGWGFNWSQMGFYDAPARASLLSWTGAMALTTYGVGGSIATTGNAELALQYFGYQTSRASIPNGTSIGSAVLSDIKQSRPVLLRGDAGSTGHIWVVDGVKQKVGYPAGCKPAAGKVGNWYHMNWGWGPGTDGWYKEGATGSYAYNRQYIRATPI